MKKEKLNKVFSLLKQYGFYFITLIFCIVIYFYNTGSTKEEPIKTVEEFRKINLKKAIEFKNLNENNRVKISEASRKLEKERSDIDWCITNNSTTGVASDCFIFNNK